MDTITPVDGHRLGRSPLFRGIRPRELGALAATMSAVRRPAGSYIARAGAEHARFGVILEGSAVVLRDHATVVARSGEHLGSELLCGSAAVASSAIAISDVELAALGGPGFDRMVRDLPVVAERLAATTSCRRPSRGRVSSG